MNRRLLLFFIAVITVFAIVATLLVLAVRKQRADEQATETPQLKISKLLDESVLAPVPSLDNNAIWYFNSTGRLFRVNSDGTNLSEFALPPLTSGSIRHVLWPKSGSDFIAITDQTKNYYNSAQKVYVKLADNIKFLDWMPDSKRIAYVWESETGQQLVVANSDGTGFSKIADISWPNSAVKISPDGKKAILWSQNPEDINKIYQIDLENGQFSTLVDLGKNIGVTWVSQNKFVFAQASSPYPKLQIFDTSTKRITDLKISAPLNNLAATSEALFIALPKSGGSDTFIKINLSDYSTENYFEPKTEVRVRSLFMAGNTVFFTDLRDGKLYTIGK